MEDLELIERHFRKELTPAETAQLTEKLAADPAFKRKFETEKLLHKALQFSRVKERITAYALKPVPVAAVPALSLNNSTLISVGATALAVWIFSTFSSSLTSLSPENIKWVGLTVAIAVSIVILALNNKTMNLKLGTIGVFNGILVFVTASGIDAINQGAEGIVGKNATEAYIIPFTGNKPWWPTQSLEDSLEENRKQMLALRNQIKDMVASRLSAGPKLNFGLPGKYATIVVPRSSTVTCGSTYEAEIFLATSPIQQTMEMHVDGKTIPMSTDPSGVLRGKVSFAASATTFDNTGAAKKKFTAGIKIGDSTYTKVVEYLVVRPK